MTDGDICYLVGDATAPVGDRPAIIVHICNDIGGWGAGFVLALSRRWPEPEAEYRRWYATGDDPTAGVFELGAAQFVPVEPGLEVANMIAQHDVVPIDGVAPVRYDAIEAALGVVAERALATGASVHMPRIGCGLAGGEWSEVEAIVARTLAATGTSTTVYDLP